jgi:acetyl-CoA acetyltransferase
MTQDVFILGGKRTPMGEYVGALKDISAIELGAIAARGALEATGVGAEEIDHTIVGNALQTSGDAIYGARHVALKAGVPFDRPALTVNRLCGSGIQAIVSGAQMIQLGEARTLFGGRHGIDVPGAACDSRGSLGIRAWARASWKIV